MDENYAICFLKFSVVFAFLYSFILILLLQFIGDIAWNNLSGNYADWGTIFLGLSFITFFGYTYDLKTHLLLSRGFFSFKNKKLAMLEVSLWII